MHLLHMSTTRHGMMFGDVPRWYNSAADWCHHVSLCGVWVNCRRIRWHHPTFSQARPASGSRLLLQIASSWKGFSNLFEHIAMVLEIIKLRGFAGYAGAVGDTECRTLRTDLTATRITTRRSMVCEESSGPRMDDAYDAVTSFTLYWVLQRPPITRVTLYCPIWVPNWV